MATTTPGVTEIERSYLPLRAALVRFFECGGCPVPEDLADESICRVLKNVSEGLEVRGLAAYARAVAKNVLMEYRRESGRGRPMLGDPLARPASGAADEKLARRLEHAKRSLSAPERYLIERYYHAGAGAAKIHSHKKLATRLGIPAQTLKLRAHRIRKKLFGLMNRYNETDSSFLH